MGTRGRPFGSVGDYKSPTEKAITKSFSLPRELLEFIEEQATKLGVSSSKVVARALQFYKDKQ